jgi:hypothetical protein
MFGFPFACIPMPLLTWATMARCYTAMIVPSAVDPSAVDPSAVGPKSGTGVSGTGLGPQPPSSPDRQGAGTVVSFPAGRVLPGRTKLPASHAATVVDLKTIRRREH